MNHNSSPTKNDADREDFRPQTPPPPSKNKAQVEEDKQKDDLQNAKNEGTFFLTQGQDREESMPLVVVKSGKSSQEDAAAQKEKPLPAKRDRAHLTPVKREESVPLLDLKSPKGENTKEEPPTLASKPVRAERVYRSYKDKVSDGEEEEEEGYNPTRSSKLKPVSSKPFTKTSSNNHYKDNVSEEEQVGYNPTWSSKPKPVTSKPFNFTSHKTSSNNRVNKLTPLDAAS